jgi:hypothetical protein
MMMSNISTVDSIKASRCCTATLPDGESTTVLQPLKSPANGKRAMMRKRLKTSPVGEGCCSLARDVVALPLGRDVVALRQEGHWTICPIPPQTRR